MYQVRLAGGSVAAEVQLMAIFSPTKYLKLFITTKVMITSLTHLLLAPSILGPS